MNASHMLRSVIEVNRQYPSRAFTTLSEMLVFSTPFIATRKVVPMVDLEAMPFVKSIAEAFAVAERFIKDKSGFWGRDYITIAMLAVNDPSLDEMTREAETTIETVRKKWFNYVTNDQRRRNAEEWQQWWQNAGVPLPDSDQSSSPTMPAYLLTWNPAKFHWPKLEEVIGSIENQGSAKNRWSTGKRKNVAIGARVYLLRQGADPRGLVGSGTIVSEVKEGQHWDPDEQKKGRKTLYAEINWNALSREPIVDRSELSSVTINDDLWNTQSGGVEIDPKVTGDIDSIWKTAWEGRQQAGIPELEPKQWIARFSADTGSKNDQLMVDRYVNAFARVIASRNLTPPLSIGLFGDWGSGKTFFMDLLHERIEELCNDTVEVEPCLYWQNICQIHFNAWHYAETNLWASLVSTIFNHLRVYLDGEKDDADEFNQLLNKLEMVGELREQAQKKLDQAKRKHKEAKQGVQTAEQALANLPEEPKPSDKEVQGYLKKSVKEAFEGNENDLAKLLRTAGETMGRVDLVQAADTIGQEKAKMKDARMHLDETKSLSSRSSFWWRILSATKFHKSIVFWIILIILLAIPVIIGVLQKHFILSDSWSKFWAVFVELLIAGGAAINWMRTKFASANGVFDQLDSFQRSIERQIEEARSTDRFDYEKERDKAISEKKDTKQKLEQALKEQQVAAKAEAAAEKSLRESTSQARLGRFIRERASSADYEKHLGLIAMVHRDFQRLSDLMQKIRDKGIDTNSRRIERIVLYIDDLDRCRPEKVVQVLEAIHLLLFFPLFVVVVGVDSRWISRALYKHYEEMLVDEAMINGDSNNLLGRAPADSQNYLEKIFQVPFWLRKMDSSAVNRLIRSLIPPEEIENLPESTVKVKPAELSAMQSDKEHQVLSNGEAYKSGRAETKIVTVEAESLQENLGEPLAPPTESLTITDIELEYMNEIAALMPRTPRSVKRFVNIYRLYKAGLSTPALGRFLGTREQPGNFRAVQVLLALVTGEPRLAQAVFHELLKEGTSDKQLSSLVDVLKKGEATWKTTLDALRKFAKGDNDIKLSELNQVSALVGRYSVHHMVSQSPGECVLG